ncbi:MAG: PxKF domain-containing protein [Pyrinomonadaceae bacterium]
MPESVATYAADCTTPKQTFAAGETACAVASGTLLGPGRIYWVDAQGAAVQTHLISPTNPSATWVVGATGNWKVYLSDFDSLRATARFSVSNPQVPEVDLSVWNNIAGSEFLAGGLVKYQVTVFNNGPDAASGTVLTQTIPNNASIISSPGQAQSCVDQTIDTTCTLGSLASGASADFTFIYQLSTGIPAGTVIANSATITSTTSELHAPDNTSFAEATVSAGAAPANCVLDCPSNMTATANTSQNGVSGAFVSFSSAEGFGECGEISSSNPSGSFFPVGSTTVVITSSTGGGGCSFTVTVVAPGGAPTITCPPNQAVTAPANSSEATVDPGTPTTNPTTGVTVSGVRSDAEGLNAPYPVGTTFITWTVTGGSGLSNSCSQRIIVNLDTCGTDLVNPSITAPADVTETTGTGGSCGFIVGESQLGTPDATDNCTVSVARAGVPAGNFFPVGTTTITYTATDGAGNTATDTQTVTVSDGTAPVIEAPADTTLQCASNVPTGGATDATASDNCGTPTVAYSESSNGGSGTTANPLVITRTYTATDAAGNSASDSQTITVIDNTAPTVTAPADTTLQCASDVPTGGATDATASDNCGTPTVAYSESSNGAGSTASPLVITRTYTATDAAGNSASDSQTITVIDNTAPTVTAPADTTLQCASNVPTGGATDATASDNCGTPTVAYSETSNGGSGTTANPLVITRTYTATDAAGNSASDSQTITVIDNTAPTIALTGANPQVVECHTSYPELGATATDNCSGNFAATPSGSVNVNTPGTYIITYNATDAAGNQAAPVTRTVTVVDTTAPVITCPANIIVSLPLNSSATSMAVNFAPTATDTCSGATVTTSVASGSAFPMGTTTVIAKATDTAGNQSSCSFTVTVLYNFTGFLSPVGNVPTVNSVNSGRAIPVKFSLSGNKGLEIFVVGYPASQQITCDSSAPLSELEGTETPGGSTLTYSPDQYHYNWKTEQSWSGTCRQLVVKLNDGTEHIALFKFK